MAEQEDDSVNAASEGDRDLRFLSQPERLASAFTCREGVGAEDPRGGPRHHPGRATDR